MKKLTRVKLINWHRFTNATIDFETSTLISGENGAGKSTLLDAIQFVVTCSTNYFNKAAHENGKRKLTGYIRCKTGRENKPYERTGEISAHVALEFYEEKKKQYFVVGAVIDSASEGQEVTARYLIDDMKFSDDMFFQGNTPKSITQFHYSNDKRINNHWYKTVQEAKKMIKNKFGRIEDKFFSLIPKAMAFRPIDDIKDFVYSYVLDKKEVNIDILRENVRTYQDLEKTLAGVKKRIYKLEIIEKQHQQVLDGLHKDKMYEYFIQRAEADITKEKIDELQKNVHSEEFRLEEKKKTIKTVTTEKNEKQEIRDNIITELAQDKEFLALDEQKKRLTGLEEKMSGLKSDKNNLFNSVKKALKQADELLKVKDAAGCIREYRDSLKDIDNIEDVSCLKQLVRTVIDYKKKMYEKVQFKLAEVNSEQKNKNAEKLELDKKINQLNQKKLSYPVEVNRVMEAIRDEFARIGRKPEPRILCEMLEITDDNWRNAVEGYLNTQRFYILVEPENFDIALGTYDKLRKERKAFGVGLINTQKLENYDEVPEGTLATVVTSKNKYAKRFTNMVLGKVYMCEHYNQLKRYPTSITKECMKYQNHVASAIKPIIYETPYIGQNAIKVQLMQAKLEQKQLSEILKKLDNQREQLETVKTPLETEMDIDIQYKIDVISEIRFTQSAIRKCKENIGTLEKNSNMIQKQIQMNTLENIIRELEQNLVTLNQEQGKIEERISLTKEEIQKQESYYAVQKASYLESAAVAGDVLIKWNAEYGRQTSDKTFDQFRENFVRRRKANETTTNNAKTAMINEMIQYKTEHDFGAAPSMEGYPDFANVYDRLKNSELLEYEEKVQLARMSAEEEFREQFLAKLQENMKQAQTEFRDLNRALQDIVFSNEKYEFIYMPSKRYRQYYEMIMDDFNAMQGESIFSGLFHENHKEVIDELFDKLALDNENNTKALEEFTDYRTYMDYDIKIVHSDRSYSYYSKVCEEKSGGETQTPFYVTVAASFVQLYKNNIGGEAVGLVMFDEAFNNMDDERIGGVLEFLRRLPLQIIIAAPPDKIQYISPYVGKTLLVMTDEKVSFVEGYHNGAI